MQAIHTLCPHLLRYLTTAVIVSSRRRQVRKYNNFNFFQHLFHFNLLSIVLVVERFGACIAN